MQSLYGMHSIMTVSTDAAARRRSRLLCFSSDVPRRTIKIATGEGGTSCQPEP
jgi:hypothetical protein